MLIALAQNYSDFPLALRVYHKLKAHGYQCFFAGGAVRDLLLGRNPQDFDLASSARPEEVEALFTKTVSVGKQFGVILVVEDSCEIEVTTFRMDGNYLDGRRPQDIQYCDAEQDAMRRDFTINALFWDPDTDKVVDYINGLQDLQNRLIKTVGLSEDRFHEDHLRIFRALRFVSQLDFELDEKTWVAIKNNANLVSSVSRERLREELQKLLYGQASLKALQLCQEAKIFESIFPDGYWQSQISEKSFAVFENPWCVFFLNCLLMGNSSEQVKNWLLSLKGSRLWRQNIENSLSWFFNQQKFNQLSLGEILELSFKVDYFQGLVAFIHFYQLENSPKWQKFLERSQELGKFLPLRLVSAEDIQSKYPEIQKEKLGRALRAVFWAQLEGIVINRQSALDWLMDFR